MLTLSPKRYFLGSKRKNFSVGLKYFSFFWVFRKSDEKFQCGTEIFQFKKNTVWHLKNSVPKIMKKFSLTLKFFSSMESLTEKFQFTIFSLGLKIFIILNPEKFQSIFGLKFFSLVKGLMSRRWVESTGWFWNMAWFLNFRANFKNFEILDDR